MEIIYLKSVNSTHTYLQDFISKNGYSSPILVYTQNQTAGIGSRDNRWVGKEGNLFFSLVIDKSFLPNDLMIQSYSIYFSFLLKDILSKYDSKIWVKWPNDFYLEDKKIGGTITHIKNNLVYVGIGLNLLQIDENFFGLDIEVEPSKLLQEYSGLIKGKTTWKQIFSKFSLEFEKCKGYKATIENEKVLLSEAILNSDGSITIDNKKVFSLR